MRKARNLHLLKVAICCGSFTLANLMLGQTWTQTSAPNTNWSCIASSADGAKLVATTSVGISNANSIWISANAGSTWIPTSAPTLNNWYYVASSADGTRLAAVAYDGIYTSADSGTTWAKTDAPNWQWRSLAMSADGTKLVASATYSISDEYIFTSVDSGATWVSNTIPASTAIFVACPANGTKLVAAVNNPGQIFTSTNMGANWESANFPPGALLYSIASSADGAIWLAGGAGSIFVTTNSGATWISNNVEYVNWVSCASSADGSILVAVAANTDIGIGGGLIFTSTNFGVTWTQADAPVEEWRGVASSADGCRLVGSASYGRAPMGPTWIGGIYTAQITPAPRMNITPTNSNLTLSWIVPSTNFVLQQNPDLTKTNWTAVTNEPVLNLTNLQDEVVLSPTNACGFYRLKTP